MIYILTFVHLKKTLCKQFILYFKLFLLSLLNNNLIKKTHKLLL